MVFRVIIPYQTNQNVAIFPPNMFNFSETFPCVEQTFLGKFAKFQMPSPKKCQSYGHLKATGVGRYFVTC